MDRWEIVDDVIDILKIGGALTQDPYRKELFSLCRAAHEAGPTEGSPSLAADGLIAAIKARWPEADKYTQLHDLNIMWPRVALRVRASPCPVTRRALASRQR